jgi:hypothetical protein
MPAMVSALLLSLTNPAFQDLMRLYVKDSWWQLKGLPGHPAQQMSYTARLKKYPVSAYLRGHGILQNQLVLQVNPQLHHWSLMTLVCGCVSCLGTAVQCHQLGQSVLQLEAGST